MPKQVTKRIQTRPTEEFFGATLYSKELSVVELRFASSARNGDTQSERIVSNSNRAEAGGIEPLSTSEPRFSGPV
jgi:hypothetical protein